MSSWLASSRHWHERYGCWLGQGVATASATSQLRTARAVAGGKNLEILGADLASQCLQRGLVDEILVYVLPVLLGDGVRFSTVRQDRPGTIQQHAVRSRDNAPLPRPDGP